LLWLRIRAYYDEFKPGARLNSITPEMIKQPSKRPRLRAKGAETRHLLPFALMLAREHTSSSHDRCRMNMVDSLFSFYRQLGGETFSADAAKEHGLCFLRLWGSLVAEAQQLGSDAYTWKPKHHLFGELLLTQMPALGDPTLSWTYLDEDLMGFASTMVAPRGGGAGPCTHATRLLTRYRLLAADARPTA
jgi:hypothetical protein